MSHVCISLGDTAFPERLSFIPTPPEQLWIHGHAARLPDFSTPSIAVVGCRAASRDGLENARAVADGLARAGVVVVSGLARGIDAAAHRAALAAGGCTIAVLGSGLDDLYPPEHRGLADEIAGTGAVVSEYPPSETARHRRIAGQGEDARAASWATLPGRGERTATSATCPRSAARCPRRSRTRNRGDASASTSSATSRPTTCARPTRRSTSRSCKAALKDASEVLLATDPDREGESISWHLREILKPKVPGPPHRLPRDHRGRRAEALARSARGRRREPGAGAGEPAHPRPAVRLHAVAGAVEEGADRAERRARAERGRPPHRRARGRAARLPLEHVLGPRGALAAGDASSPRRWCASATSASRPARTSTRHRRAGSANACAPRRGRGARASPTALRAACRGRSRAVDEKPGHAAARAAVHHLDAAAGGQPQARVLDRADDADRAAAVPGRGAAAATWKASSRITAPTRRRSATRRCASRPRPSARCSARVLQGAAPVPDEGAQRAGGARGHPAHRLPPARRSSSKACSTRDELRSTT
jgi:hypothetical protein